MTSAREIIGRVRAKQAAIGYAHPLHTMPDDLDLEQADQILSALADAGFQIVRWEPIETAPKDGTPILIFRLIQGWRVFGSASWVSAAGIQGWLARGVADIPGELGLAAPTHWQPLPAPPND